MTIDHILNDNKVLYRTTCQIVHVLQMGQGQADQPMVMRMMKLIERHRTDTGSIVFKATSVFLRCVMAMRGDRDRTFKLITNTGLNVLRVFIQEFAYCVNVEIAMEASQDEVDSGRITEGLFLEDCNLLKTLHELQEFSLKHSMIVMC